MCDLLIHDTAMVAVASVLLNLDERANLGLLADPATVQIDQRRVKDGDAAVQDHVLCNRHGSLQPKCGRRIRMLPK